jgi:hypothetical protein
MVKATLVGLSLVSAIAGFGQGLINFNNRVTGAGGVVAPIYGPEPGDPTRVITGNATTNGGTASYTGHLLLGTGYTAQLWGGPAGSTEDQLVLISTVPFRTSTSFAGFVQNPPIAPSVPGVPAGAQATFQLRVWDNQNGTLNSWTEALAAWLKCLTVAGKSDLFTPPPLVVPPGTPPNLVGLTSFCIRCVPEPSVISFGALGLGVLLLRRHKAKTR